MLDMINEIEELKYKLKVSKIKLKKLQNNLDKRND